MIDAPKACVDLADPYVPRFNRTFLEYASFRGFLPDPARPYHAQDKPVVERYVTSCAGKNETMMMSSGPASTEVWFRKR